MTTLLDPALVSGASTVAPADRIPLSRAFTNGREHELVAEVLTGGQLTQGEMLARFEGMMASVVGAEHAIAVGSGGAALRLACAALDLPDGSEIIASPFEVVAASRIARALNAVIRYVDVDPETLALDLDAVEASVTPRTSLVLPSHAFGWPLDVRSFAESMSERGIAVVEDARGAIGAREHGRGIGGGSGVPVVFDFGAKRAVTTGEGGIVCTDDPQLAQRMRGCVEHSLSDLACAVGIAQLEKLPRMLTMRREVAADYTRLLAGIDGVEIPCADVGQRQRGWSTYLVRLASSVDREQVIERMRVAGVEVGPGVPPIHRSSRIDQGRVPVAVDVAARTLVLPLYPHLSPHQQQRVVAALDAALRAA